MLLASHLVMLMMRIKLSEKDLGNFKESLSSLTIDQEVSVAGFGLVTPSMILDKNEKTIENKFSVDKTRTFKYLQGDWKDHATSRSPRKKSSHF